VAEDERVVRLLEEIRDLQKQHVENYHEALKNQRESIDFQRDWQRRLTRRQVIALVALVLVMLALWALSRGMRF